ncbi:MAG TPA: TonB-dependent receptor [Gemmatimonadales bacterium]|nr:TonB-dependent receptor [Gemmatimonadales bacterium]
MAVNRALGLALSGLLTAASAAAQGRIDGVVADSASAIPLAAARVSAGTHVVLTDRFGRFSIAVEAFPVTLVVARIGVRPDSFRITTAPKERLRLLLVPRVVQVADLVVTAPSDPSLAGLGRWTVPIGDGVIPPVGVPDVMRDLSATPAVTQSNITSARPLIRGYDAGEATILLDGFDLPNPYHLGRAFSSLPVEAVAEVGVATAPLDPSIGGTSGAAVDLTGKTGQAGSGGEGLFLSPITLTGWGDASLGGTKLFAGTRYVTVDAAARAAGKHFPYHFNDLYASLLSDRGGAPFLRATLFTSRDKVDGGDREEGGDLMSWGVTLLGLRAEAWRRGSDRLELSGHVAHFDEEAAGLEFGGSTIEVDNALTRIGLGVEWSRALGDRRLVLGVSPNWRGIDNRVAVTFGSLTPADDAFSTFEMGAYGSWADRIGAMRVNLGARYDRAGGVGALQPRLRAELPVGANWTLGAAVGRSARFYHQVTDPRTTADFILYDLWKVAGEDGIPAAKVDHALVTASWGRGAWSLRGAAFASHGSGMVEVRPATTPQVGGTAFRVGHSRTAGVELQGGVGGARGSLTLSYALTWSERDWGKGWIPWSQDRRHLLRLVGQGKVGGWRATVMSELLSAPPLTPVDQVVRTRLPTAEDGADYGTVTYLYGAENSARGAGTFRTDLGLEREFGGPFGSRGSFTFSVTNLTFGPVTPIVPDDPVELQYGGVSRSVQYVRLFDMPAIPMFGVRFEF